VNLVEFIGAGIIGLGFVLIFFALILFFAAASSRLPKWQMRSIPAFNRLNHAIGLAVEAGERIHLSLGRGSLSGLKGSSPLVGLSLLGRISRDASVSDRPPVTTSGDGTLTLLSQDTLKGTLHDIGAEGRYDMFSGRMSGLTPFSYAGGTLPVIYDEQVAASILAGHFGSEVALIADATEQKEGLTLAGSDSIPAQAVLLAAAQEPLIGEELYAAGAYTGVSQIHKASLRAQDVLRWLVMGVILVGSGLKLLGLI
jgi:hypothetical protein